MKALCWHGKGDIRVDRVADPVPESPTDAIIGITSTAICGSDLHIYGGIVPMRRAGARADGRGRRGRTRRAQARGGRPRGGAVHDLVWGVRKFRDKEDGCIKVVLPP
jgi:threonine dehydrogenase-like Zn-dependent dehydrogenase